MRLAVLFVGLLLVGGCGHVGRSLIPRASPQLLSASAADVTAPENWLTQKVCVDGSNVVAAVDPFSPSDPFGNGCAGYTERNMQQSDAVPYYRYSIPPGAASLSQYWYAYAFPVTSPAGEPMFAMVRELVPQNSPPVNWYVNPTHSPAMTHWDLYRVQGGWVSNASTRDAVGLNQTFFGNSGGTATPYNGWIDFPLSFLSGLGAPASTSVPVSDRYWEQSAMPWPLPPQAPPTSSTTLTSWTLLAGYAFESGKRMNAIAVYHQSKPQPTARNPDNGHMEIWYFTMPYGPSRWEVWSAAHCLSNGSCKTNNATQQCAPAQPQTYPYGTSSFTYYRTNCVDWTRTAVAAVPSTLPPVPIPETNLLADMHFSSDPVNTAGSASGWSVGGGLTLVQLLSTLPVDTQNGKYPGVRYVRVSCVTVCSDTSVLTQDVPLSAGGTYTFGVDARTESGSGLLQISISQIDAAGAVIAGSTASAALSITQAGSASACNASTPSVVTCGTYVGGVANLILQPGAAALRETLAPGTAGTQYDITDAYLSRQ